MTDDKKLTDVEQKAVNHVKKTFKRELQIERMTPNQFLKSKRMSHELNNLNKMLEGNKGCSILTLARIADAFGYDIELIKRPIENETEN